MLSSYVIFALDICDTLLREDGVERKGCVDFGVPV